MLWKLSLTGIKGRMRDYIVLFSGLVMASAIFYMFESMASNEAFLKSNSTVASTVLIFRLGSVLLGIITFVYVLYANSFLMMMRQKDYAMFMTLGAKGSKIAQMIFTETFVVGSIATLVGSAVGIGLTTIVNSLLVEQLNLKITHFSPLSVHGLIYTIVFFVLLFLLAAIVNAVSIVKKPILTLLRANQTPAEVKQNKLSFALEVIFGVVFLGIGYYVMTELGKFQLMGIVIALITIVLGTYLVFHSVIIFCLSLLKKSESISMRKLNNFTISQLTFRMREYTQMLSMVAMLFALALGALTVGLGFRNEIAEFTRSVSPYDVYLNNAQKVDQSKVDKADPTFSAVYDQKENDSTIYFNIQQFEEKPLYMFKSKNIEKRSYTFEKIPADKLAADVSMQDELRQYLLPEQETKEIKVVSKAEFDQLALPDSQLQLIKVKDFAASLEPIEKLVNLNVENNPSYKGREYAVTQKYDAYEMFNGIFSGLEFMGFFLGLAFLTMLASCLMFKILSGANSDTVRYEMLEKIGTRQHLLKQSIRREIGVLFLAPGILGVVHVLFGLNMFKLLMSNPYYDLWIPFTIFFVLYLFYYILTTWIYTGIVLKKRS
ncbi:MULTISPECIES: ABC transporter permease [unclassified Enterococcus]|jgi:putative ABC transport system permease protein|uniref:ABC transporter permease n=1 Tax=unclassified Enterococcus TaxID=2608891 RepID=UPI0003542C3B|nr:efflux ABC transporter, permease protein [Enterococcus faecalis 13-SD-W-01]